jgi:hypothetical protein
MARWLEYPSDVVIPLPKPYTVPAKAVIPWLDFVVPTNFTKDTWCRRRIRPGARRVVHHATITFVPPGPIQKRSKRSPPANLFRCREGSRPKRWSHWPRRSCPSI